MNDKARRPLKSRGTGWASRLTALLLKTPITPNQISFIGLIFAVMGAGAMMLAQQSPWWWLLAALGIQLRLLANLMDGLVAVEGGRGSPTGALFNELPDRPEDAILLVAAGYASGMAWLGWLAALLALMTAYVRVLGASLGQGHDFGGPMAKQHRMAALTLGAIVCCGVGLANLNWPVMQGILAIIVAGSVLTIIRRTLGIVSGLNAANETQDGV